MSEITDFSTDDETKGENGKFPIKPATKTPVLGPIGMASMQGNPVVSSYASETVTKKKPDIDKPAL